MKKLFAFLLIFTSSFLGFSQENQAVVKGNETEFATQVEKGVFNFILPEGTDPLEVEKNSVYYAKFFKVNYNKVSREAIITMIVSSEEARHVIVRFLISNKIRTVKLGNTEYTVSEFYETHLK